MSAVTATYELPFGHGRRFLGGEGGVRGQVVGGWTINNIVTLQSGFPFTPQLGYNPSNDGDTRNPVRPFLDPSFTGPVVLGNPKKWFNPAAFIAPPNNSGFLETWGGTHIPALVSPLGFFRVEANAHLRKSEPAVPG